ncbi:MAG TPA: DJ-1/PfpI family protein [Planctomycetota bacterium]|nr:DJ-1/PfpI family protein [Planctomycetota bacterium]
MPKVLLPIGDASEVLDTMYPIFRLPEAGFEVTVAGREARHYHLVIHEIPPGWEVTRESPGYHLEATIRFRDVRPEEYAGLFLTGGRAPEYLRYDEDLLRLTRSFFAAEKPVAAICHGIEILTAAGCIEGRRVTTVPKCKLDAEQGGATFVDEPAVVDGNLVTARTWHDNAALFRPFIRMLETHVSGLV